MKLSRLHFRRFQQSRPRCTSRRSLLTLAIETSCDDTSVAILEKHNSSAKLHFHRKIASDHRSYGGVYPIVAHESHQKHLAGLVTEALRYLPPRSTGFTHKGNTLRVGDQDVSVRQQIPDFVTVTRGPGMRANLITGVDMAKGLAVAWQVPILGVNHMQAHALTPRMMAALETQPSNPSRRTGQETDFPFLSLLVSGGHTMLVHSRELCEHKILANTVDIAVGDVLDKCAREILPQNILDSSKDVMYGRLLEAFAFPSGEVDYKYEPKSPMSKNPATRKTAFGWSITPPFQQKPKEESQFLFSFSGIGSTAKRAAEAKPDVELDERQALAREVMRVTFEHLATRILIALEDPKVKDVKTLVVSGGVASNKYLTYLLRKILDANGHEDINLLFPSPEFCTDNAAMIAWTGMEMYEAGWSSELDFMAMKKWSIDPEAGDGGILGVDGWKGPVDHVVCASASE